MTVQWGEQTRRTVQWGEQSSFKKGVLSRIDDGAAAGVERRLRALGNGVVPAVAALAFRELSKALNKEI